MSEENKALVRRFVNEVQSGGNIDAIDKLCAPGFVNHSAPPGMPSDCEGLKHVMTMFRQAFPDSYFTIEGMVAEGDKVATRKTFYGTHQGELWAFPQQANRYRLGSSISCASLVGRWWNTGL
ncbi:MAG TPA: ester cyclase [Rubrobacteraceae bacterium]|nr:ester cyclase [Rubrobacteraceae bacterium]